MSLAGLNAAIQVLEAQQSLRESTTRTTESTQQRVQQTQTTSSSSQLRQEKLNAQYDVAAQDLKRLEKLSPK
jgi:hypothetical protein